MWKTLSNAPNFQQKHPTPKTPATSTWTSQEVSKWIVDGLFHLYLYMGYIYIRGDSPTDLFTSDPSTSFPSHPPHSTPSILCIPQHLFPFRRAPSWLFDPQRQAARRRRSILVMKNLGWSTRWAQKPGMNGGMGPLEMAENKWITGVLTLVTGVITPVNL